MHFCSMYSLSLPSPLFCFYIDRLKACAELVLQDGADRCPEQFSLCLVLEGTQLVILGTVLIAEIAHLVPPPLILVEELDQRCVFVIL